MFTRSLTRRLWRPRHALALAAVLVVASCTSSSGAAPETTEVAPSSTTTTSEARADLDIDLGGTTTSTGQADEILVPFPREVISTDGTKIVSIDTATGDAHTLVAVEPLPLGADPSEGERIARLDVGGDRMVVFETHHPDGFPRINVLTADRRRIDVGHGQFPTVRPDGTAFAYVGPRGLTVMWSPESELDSGFHIPGAVTGLRFSPDGARLAVAWENEGRGGITLVDLEPNGFVGSSEITPPFGRRFDLPSWIDDDRLAVLDVAETLGGTGAVLVIDVTSLDEISSTPLDDVIVDLDHVVGGANALVVTTDGELKWLTDGATGDVHEAFALGARW